MLVCDLFPPILFLLVMTSSATQTTTRTVLSACNSSGSCPAQSSCTFRHPDGHLCICNEGFAASSNKAVCEKAVYLNEGCKSACAGLFTICDETSKKCVCYREYVVAADGKNCIEAGMGLLGGACGSGCAFSKEQVCVDGVCRCKMDSRPMTEEEIRAFSNPQSQCISSTYRLDRPILSTTNTTGTTPSTPSTTAALPNHTKAMAPLSTPAATSATTYGPELGAYSKELVIGLAVGFGLAFLLAAIFASLLFVQRHKHFKQLSSGTHANADSLRNGTSSGQVTNITTSQNQKNSNYLNLPMVTMASFGEGSARHGKAAIGGNSDAYSRNTTSLNSNGSNGSQRQGTVREPEVPQMDIATGISAAVLTHDTVAEYMNVNQGTDIYSHADTPDTYMPHLYTTLS